MSNLKRIFKVIIVTIFILILYGMNCNEVEAAVVSPAMGIKKAEYNENEKVLVVQVFVKPGITMKKFDFTMSYGSNLEWIPWDSGRDIFINDNSNLGIENYSCSPGEIWLESYDLGTSETTVVEDITCQIKFKVLGTTLEEDIPNNLFTIERVEVTDDDDVYDTIDLIDISSMASVITKVEAQNIVFEKSAYKNGQLVNANSGQVVITYNNAKTRTVDLATLKDNAGNSIDIKKEGTWLADFSNPYVQLSYKGVKSNKITVPMISYELSNNTLVIPYGHQIVNSDLTNYQIIVKKTGEANQYIPITADMITYNAQGEIGDQIAYVNYSYNGEIEQLPLVITLENYVSYIYLTHNNVTVDYDSKLDASTLTNEYKVISVMANGDIGASGYVRDYINPSEVNTRIEGSYIINVAFAGKTARFTVVVVDPIIGIKLEDEEKEKIQKEYKYKEELQLNGAQLTVVKLSGELKIDLTKEMIKNYNSEEIAVQELNIEYENLQIERAIDIEVKDYIIDIILIKPDKTSYLPGETIDLTGATVQTLSASGVLGNVVPVTMDMISGYNANEMGTQRITVSYEGFEKTFDVILGVQTGPRRYQRLWNISNDT